MPYRNICYEENVNRYRVRYTIRLFWCEPLHPNHHIWKVYKEKLTKTPFSHEKRVIRYTHSRKFYVVSLVPKYMNVYVYMHDFYMNTGESMPLLIPRRILWYQRTLFLCYTFCTLAPNWKKNIRWCGKFPIIIITEFIMNCLDII